MCTTYARVLQVLWINTDCRDRKNSFHLPVFFSTLLAADFRLVIISVV